MIEIRDATIKDAPAACNVLRRSISKLCVADHGNDPEILARWLGNKTPENVASWIAEPGKSVLVAIEDNAMLGVGMITDAGEIQLIYVSPRARFRGVSKALLSALEEQAIKLGNMRCSLTSTETARRFYLSAGFIEEERPKMVFGVMSYPMSKSLADRIT
jgi:GNAT superfamily N-acetyltransferase